MRAGGCGDGPQSTDPLYTHEGAPSSPFLPAGSDLGEREEEAGSQLKIKKERWPTPSSLHFHFLFLFLSSLQEDGGRLGIVSAFPEPLGVKSLFPGPSVLVLQGCCQAPWEGFL